MKTSVAFLMFLVMICAFAAILDCGCSTPRHNTDASANGGQALPPLPELQADEAEEDYRYSAWELDLTWPQPLPKAPATMAVYRIVEQQRNAVDLLQIEEKLNGLEVPAASWLAEGKTASYHSLRRQDPPLAGQPFPDQEQAIAIARKCLQATNLWRDEVGRPMVCNNTYSMDVRSAAMGVWFFRQIDGRDLPSARISVQVGRGGQVREILFQWPQLEKIGDYPIITAGEAKHAVNAGRGRFSEGLEECGTVTGEARKLELAYRQYGASLVAPAWTRRVVAPKGKFDVGCDLPAVDRDAWGPVR